MRRPLLWAVALFALFSSANVRAQQEEEQDLAQIIDQQLSELETDGLGSIYDGLDPEITGLFGAEGFEELVKNVAEGDPAELEGGLGGLLDFVVSRLKSRLTLLLALLALAAVGGISAQLRQSGSIAGLVCYAMSIVVAIYAFAQTAAQAKETAETAQKIMELTLPALLTMLTAAGAAASSSMLTPVAGLLTTGVMSVFSGVLLPAILAMGICAMVGNLSGRKTLDRMNGFLKSVVKWVGGAVSVLYMGYGAIMGIAAKGADGLSVKLIRYSADKLIPVIGSMVSGSVDTIMHASVLVKNALGVGSVLLMFGVMLAPLVEIMSLQLTFRLAAALTEPYGDERLIKGISSLADVMSYLFAVTAGIAAMFAVTVSLIAAAGNAVL